MLLLAAAALGAPTALAWGIPQQIGTPERSTVVQRREP
jgi:hypothetical protein